MKRFVSLIVLIVILLFLFAPVAFAQAPTEPPKAMEPNPIQLVLAGVIAGILAPFVVQLIKNQLKWVDDKAFYLTLVIALIGGFLAAVGGGLTIPTLGGDPIAFVEAWVAFMGVVFTLATIIYYKILEKMENGPLANATPYPRLN